MPHYHQCHYSTGSVPAWRSKSPLKKAGVGTANEKQGQTLGVDPLRLVLQRQPRRLLAGSVGQREADARGHGELAQAHQRYGTGEGL